MPDYFEQQEFHTDRAFLYAYYPDPHFGAGGGVGGVIEGLVVPVHPECPDTVPVLEPLALRHVVGALHHEVTVGELHLLEPGGGVVVPANGRPPRGHAAGTCLWPQEALGDEAMDL